ncbi:hypothetical protein [Corynebacterium sp. HMSC074A01]|uniref:hypothetical protein n=1 Tax=Corynebacterium sp. HMSC074A01 TaxID=1715030 RepID=UPI0008A31E0E|nr:hypothetical protein [Corynebacterium sp. HMSC074A01]OHF37393.1 hypothetical protein HMPREF2550_03215 [Corynebacterium sp. HMSC074A01]
MISVSRTAAAGLVAVAAVSLAACHPPHQVDSEQKVDTATSQKAESLASYGATTSASSATATSAAVADETPTIANCGAVELERPTELTLDCQGQDDVLRNITWDSWEADMATGTGTRNAQQPEVAISLSNPQVVNGVLAYTDITVDGTAIYPEGN